MNNQGKERVKRRSDPLPHSAFFYQFLSCFIASRLWGYADSKNPPPDNILTNKFTHFLLSGNLQRI